MTASISPQVRIVALLGLLAAAGLAVWTFALAHRPVAAPAAPVAVAHPAPAPPAAQPRPKPLLLRLDPSLPAPLLHALRYSRVVVAAIYLPGDARDRQALLAARQGARDARVGFAALDVADERVAAAIAGRLDPVADPAVLVVTRPGRVALELTGSNDRQTVAQAAANVHG